MMKDGRMPEDIEMFLNMPEVLYILRMNEDGTDVEIEEHTIAPYPEFKRLLQQLMQAERPIKACNLRAWGFESLMEEAYYADSIMSGSPLKRIEDEEQVILAVQYDMDVNTLKTRVLAKRIELTLEKAGIQRVVDYSVRKPTVDRILSEMKKALKGYSDRVEEVRKLLRENMKHLYGCESGLNSNIRLERYLDNLNDYCSSYYMCYVFEKPFLKLVFRLGHIVRIDPILTVYDVPCWEFDFMNGSLSVRRNNELQSADKSFDDWMHDVFKEPEEAGNHRKQIKEQINKVFGFNISDDEICYEPASMCYMLCEDLERSMLGDLIPTKAGDIKEIAKYTSFETLVTVLKSGKMRMNSIVSMNDKTETDFLDEAFRSYKEDFEYDYDKYLFADKEFITSFTTRIDDLDMWRFYGDNARGVCMVFERDSKRDDELYKIKYVEPAQGDLSKVYELMDALKNKGVRFQLNLLQKYRHFMKHADYDTEEEYRLLVRSDKPDGWFVNGDNGILTPYLEFELRKTGSAEVGEYPFKLKRVIIGPAMKENVANLMQVFYMEHQYGYSLEVAESQKQSYR